MYKPEKCYNSKATTYFSSKNLFIGEQNGKIKKFNRDLEYEFQSHSPEFDYLESNEISEKIVAICELDADIEDKIICSNEKTIRIWKIKENGSVADRIRHNGFNCSYFGIKENQNNNINSITHQLICEKKNIHSYPINTITRSDDLLMSSDYLRIMMWNLNKMEHFKVTDIKPLRFDELTFVITQSNFKDDNTFGYSTSQGEIYLNDIRTKSIPQLKLKLRKIPQFDIFDELLRSISSFKFKDNFVIARNFNSILIFDIRNQSLILNLQLFQTDIPLIEKIYSNDSGYDRFSVEVRDNEILTGGFDGKFYVGKFDGSLDVYETNFFDSLKYCCFWKEKIVVCSKNQILFYNRD